MRLTSSCRIKSVYLENPPLTSTTLSIDIKQERPRMLKSMLRSHHPSIYIRFLAVPAKQPIRCAVGRPSKKYEKFVREVRVARQKHFPHVRKGKASRF